MSNDYVFLNGEEYYFDDLNDDELEKLKVLASEIDDHNAMKIINSVIRARASHVPSHLVDENPKTRRKPHHKYRGYKRY